MKGLRIGVPAVVLAVAMACASSTVSAATDYSGTIDSFKDSPQVQPFFEKAYGYAVFPTIGKGGLGIGGAYGEGQVYREGKATGISKLVKLSFGFQAGGQVFSEIIFFEDKRAYDEFTSGQFAFDAQASAVAITAGVQAQAGSTGGTMGASAGPKAGAHVETKYHRGMAIFVQAKGGLMYEAAVAGQKFSFEPYK